ncbi:MAG: hypothetical protein GY953_25460, partial [bacterium]|nr:hypothetical protein [bacterium]
PRPAELRDRIRRREKLQPNLQHELIVLEERLIEAGNIETVVAEWVERVGQADESAAARELQQTVRSLATRRRDLLNDLFRDKNGHAAGLFELTAASQDLLRAVAGLDNYLFERILWVRSVPGPKIPPAIDVTGAGGWLFFNKEWGAILLASVAGMFGDVWLVLGLAAIALLLIYRRRLLAALARTADATESDFGATLKSLVVTLALTVPLPLIFLWLGRFLTASLESELAAPEAEFELAAGGPIERADKLPPGDGSFGDGR